MTRSIAELQTAGVVFQADEAVAVALQLMAALRAPHSADQAAPPFGPPSADNVLLSDDGTVACRGCSATLAVSEVGILLESLLGQGSPRVPGGLRYTIARALLNVDVPPFDSLDAFAQDLARHERGDRADAVKRVLRRALRPGSGQALRPGSGQAPSDAVAIADRRRRNHAAASELRRALREADARLFEQEHLRPRPQVIDLVRTAPPAPSRVEGRERAFTAAAACVAAGLALIGAGELMHHHPAATAAPASAIEAPATTTARTAAEPVAAESDAVRQAHGLIAVRPVSTRLTRVDRPVQRPVTVKRVRRTRSGGVQTRDRGVMDRLKLGWLRRAFTVHSDL